MGNRVEGAENHCANASPTDAVNPSGAAVSAVSPPVVHHSVQSSRNPLNDPDPACYLTLARIRSFALPSVGQGGLVRPPLAFPNEAS